MPPLWVCILGDSIVCTVSTVKISHVQRSKHPGKKKQHGNRGVGLSWGWLGDNKVATRKLLFWDVTKLMARYKMFWRIQLVVVFCAKYTNMEVWSVGGSSWEARFLAPEICQAFCVWEHHLSHDALHSFYTWTLALGIRTTSYPTCFVQLWIIFRIYVPDGKQGNSASGSVWNTR